MNIKNKILSATNKGLDVFQHYISTPFVLGRNFINPFYDDSKASCNIYLDSKSDCYRLKDFGNSEYDGDCFSLVGKIINKDCNQSREFVDILNTITNDLNLPNFSKNNNQIKPPKKENSILQIPLKPENNNRPFTISQKPFSEYELSYWGSYGITFKELERYNVISIYIFNSVSREGKSFQIVSTEHDPIYGYSYKGNVKIYRPLNSKIRFLRGGDKDQFYCFGLEQLPSKGDILFITGGEKDVLSLASHGFNAICFNSETTNIPFEIVKKLSYIFKHIVILFDMDKTGLESSLRHQQQFKELNVKRLLLPLSGDKGSKDISDYFKLGNNATALKELFSKLLDTIYSETMSLLNPCEIDFKQPPPQPEMILSVNNIPLGTQGNLLCITGGEGSGKSNYIGSIIAGAICNNTNNIDTLGINVAPNYNSKAVLMYDTEQSEGQLHKNSSNILRRAKLTSSPNFLKIYCLTSMSRRQRMQSIIESMDKFHYQYDGIQLVVIDGIADLIKGANDEQESVAIVEELYRLAGIYNTCIVCVLHYVPNGLKLRGHLGSELQRKAAAILSIEKDSDPRISVVKALKVRDGSPLDIPIMQFAWDRDKSMHCYIGDKPIEDKDKRKEEELIDVAMSIFREQHSATYLEICERLQSVLEVKERTAKSYVKFMLERNIVSKDLNNNHYIKGKI